MLKMNDTEKCIYAAAYVAEYDRRRRDVGFRDQFRVDAEKGKIKPEDAASLWEQQCCDGALRYATFVVTAHRRALKRAEDEED